MRKTTRKNWSELSEREKKLATAGSASALARRKRKLLQEKKNRHVK